MWAWQNLKSVHLRLRNIFCLLNTLYIRMICWDVNMDLCALYLYCFIYTHTHTVYINI